jgi:hypothetical protein
VDVGKDGSGFLGEGLVMGERMHDGLRHHIYAVDLLSRQCGSVEAIPMFIARA